MTLRLLICCLLAAISAAAIYHLVSAPQSFITYYIENLRGNLFAGFLSVGGFLLSLKTFIIIKLKENVYDHTQYREKFHKMKQLDAAIELYRPLQNLSDFLFWAVLSSIIAAVLQLTVGLVENLFAVLFSLAVCVFAISTLVVSLILIKTSLNDYFEFINEETASSSNSSPC